MNRIEFERFEVWASPFLEPRNAAQMVGNVKSLGDAKAIGDAVPDFREKSISIRHIVLTDQGREEHTWVKSHDGGHWLALDRVTRQYVAAMKAEAMYGNDTPANYKGEA